MTPAPVDHDERRARLTEVLLDVVAEGGLEAATIRTVAAAAGVSIGTVQHYFKTKDDMLGHAYRTVGKEIGDRAEQEAEGATSWKAAIRAILLELLPLDERRAKGYRVSVAFAARATWNPELGAELRKDLKELQDIFVDMLSPGRRPGRRTRGDDAARAQRGTRGAADVRRRHAGAGGRGARRLPRPSSLKGLPQRQRIVAGELAHGG